MKWYYLFLAFLLLGIFQSCSDNDDKPELIIDPVEMGTFAKGADVSWVTQMEADGVKFYNAKGEETECMRLMRDLGMNTIRLRVWVNPSDGWCNKADVLTKAVRAHNLGMRLMIDFHYSDIWADPGKQTKPVAWHTLSLSKLKTAVADHTKDILKALKEKGIAPEWVQVGNETGNGMLWPDGQADKSMANYAALNNAGYDAVKSVFPEAKVIVHLQNGQDNSLYRWLFDGLKANGGKWDLIGMSLYPDKTNWQKMVSDCIANIQDVTKRYGTDVIICETGMPWDQAAAAKAFLTDLFTQTQALGNVHGILYWEPEAYNAWNGYTLGAFDASGKPTEALDAFTLSLRSGEVSH
ncbi:MAG: arabinogalactan endo-1,4-beta-galactosidase [Oscillibacter sp.]|nr:arabinogalactan endo-1,4-beta-galactosidase [Oscillibacter sp.]